MTDRQSARSRGTIVNGNSGNGRGRAKPQSKQGSAEAAATASTMVLEEQQTPLSKA